MIDFKTAVKNIKENFPDVDNQIKEDYIKELVDSKSNSTQTVCIYNNFLRFFTKEKIEDPFLKNYGKGPKEVWDISNVRGDEASAVAKKKVSKRSKKK